MAGPSAVEKPPVGAIAVSDRSLAPDLARGALLLLIALANVCLYQYEHPTLGEGRWLRGSPVADQIVLLLETIFVRDRAYPMYALLFGYGMVQMLRRHSRKGVDETAVSRLVRRRGWWMVLIGFGHALLLFCRDIIGAYGFIAVLFAGVLFRARDRTLLIVSALWVVLIALFRGLAHRLSSGGGGLSRGVGGRTEDLALTVSIPPVLDLHHRYPFRGVVYLIDDSILADADTPIAAATDQGSLCKTQSQQGAPRSLVSTPADWCDHQLPARPGVAEFDTRVVCFAINSRTVELGDTRADRFHFEITIAAKTSE